MRPLEMPVGARLMALGDPAEDLFLVEAGELEVRRDGQLLAVLGQGDHVGEVGLLRGRPRNATVTARTEAMVWAIDGPVFLEAVTGHPQSQATAEDVTAERES
jgi:CRP/FNR family cyclic AMP-dependent transcriptional regulator